MRRNPGETTFKKGRTWMRRCYKCGEVKALRSQFYKKTKHPQKNWTSEYSYACKPCEINRNVEKIRRKEADPAYKQYRAELMRRWRAANPEKEAAMRRRYLEKLKADPKRHIPYLELRRMESYLRREKDNVVTFKFQPGKMLKYEEHMLPAKPLYLAAKKYVEGIVADGGTVQEACKNLETTDREYRRWLNMEQTKVRWETADRLLTNLGLHWWDVWSEEEVPEKIAA